MSFANAYRGAKAAAVRSVAIAGLALALAGCETVASLNPFGRGETYEPEIVETRPAAELYNEGLSLIDRGQYQSAAERFEEIEEAYPFSDFARRALVMQAYAQFAGGAYDDSTNTAQRYLQLYPGQDSADYAQYILAMSNFNQIPDITRDQTRTAQALRAFQELIDRYPDSDYVEDARAKIVFANDQLAGKEMEVGRFYLERRNYTGAINRFRTVVASYQTTRHSEEALARLTEAYMAMGIVDEAQTAAAVLGHNFPESQWYRDSYALLQSGGLEPRENRQSWISRAFRGFTRAVVGVGG
ncbi:outer membrane protein assembly factor BamD [Salinarimonas sp. NSM]|uniref:outer membrane protein assembly factor BamD n=1 Tax=Salinarimonas sp. NSM TaxID=3458003 RepID=UPI004035F57C